MGCSRRTKKGQPCPNEGDRLDDEGKWVCHVHDPHGLFRQQTEQRKKEKLLDRARQKRRMLGLPDVEPS